MSIEKHEFAFYIDYADTLEHEFSIDDPLLLHRFKDIVRLKLDDTIIVFNQSLHVRAAVCAIHKKSIVFKLLSKEQNKVLKPPITFLLPLLKKEALMDALYSMAEFGATTVQLVITKKVQRPWIEKEVDRLQRIIIAAAEQSKNFSFPVLYAPKNLTVVLDELQPHSERIFFDQGAAKVYGLIQSLVGKKITMIYGIVGPEGDFTSEEKELLTEHAFCPYSLTQTVLRSGQAAGLGLGLLRSIV